FLRNCGYSVRAHPPPMAALEVYIFGCMADSGQGILNWDLSCLLALGLSSEPPCALANKRPAKIAARDSSSRSSRVRCCRLPNSWIRTLRLEISLAQA